jgi:thiol reductant ABC exporter CydD subunit
MIRQDPATARIFAVAREPDGEARVEGRERAGIVDPRLLRETGATRSFIAVCVGLGCASALLVIAQAWLLADVVAEAFLGGRDLADLRVALAALLAVVLARATVAWAAELSAARASAEAKSQLRGSLLAAGAELAARGDGRARAGDLAVLGTRGIDALDAYFSLYLPQVVLAVVVPVAVVAAVLADDWISAAIIAVTIPLIPLFMALVGAATREHTDAQLRGLQQLAGHFLDVVAGLPTLKIFGRARAQAQTIAEVTERYRQRLLATLRITFLSSLILELVATVSVAIVAVAIGIRLMDGGLGLRAGLFALVLAPEAYLPLRRLGANYHASSEGIAAAEHAFAVIEAPAARRPTRPARAPDPATEALVVDDLTLTYPGRSRPALSGVSLELLPGEVLAVSGPSGCGKSTLLGVVLGLLTPDSGSVRVGQTALASLDRRSWHERLAWVPQRPHLFRASVLENVRLGRPDAHVEEVWPAIHAAGLADVVRDLPGGLATVLGDGGFGLSAGERQRLALARAFLRDAPLLLLDEPTAALDGETERGVLEALRRLLAGRTAILVAHRGALLDLCDRVLSLDAHALAA